MEDQTQQRIAEALERIATALENKERREVNASRKSKIEENKLIKSKPIRNNSRG